MTKTAMILLSLICFSSGAREVENICSIMYPRSGSKDWGIGALYLPSEFEANIYVNTEGKLFGKLKREKHELKLVQLNGKKILAHGSPTEFIAHTSYCFLKVKSCPKPDYFMVYWNLVEGPLFVKKEEMEMIGAIYNSYKDILFKKSTSLVRKGMYNHANIGVNLDKSCLNLNAEPKHDAKIILCVRSNDWSSPFFTHFKFLEIRNTWVKVEASQYQFATYLGDDEVGCNYFLKDKKVGWIQAIDKNGFPNVWFSLSSY